MIKSVFSDLIIVIVNLNQKDVTRECVESIVEAGIVIPQIVIVDNGSSDGSVSYLRRLFGKSIRIIQKEKNLGYANALNAGIAGTQSLNKTWYLLMNNDTVVAKDFFVEIKKCLSSYPEYLLFSPMILYYHNPDMIWFLGNKRIPGTLITYDPYKNKSSSKYKTPEKIDFLNGCAMIINSSVFKQIGLFNDWSVIYSEEVDFCWRAKLAGYKMMSVPGAKMWHKVSAYMGKHKPRTRYLRVRNQAAFYKRYSAGLLLIVMWLFSFFRVLVLSFSDILRGEHTLIKPMWIGWYDGWSGQKAERF